MPNGGRSCRFDEFQRGPVESVNGAAAWIRRRPASPLFSLPASNPDRPNLIQRWRSARTPSLVNLAKEPLYFSVLEPAVPSRFKSNLDLFLL